MAKIVDLTLPIYGMWPNLMAGQWPTLPKTSIRVVHSYNTHKSHLSEVAICCHVGTHIDSPFHMMQDGKKLHEYPLEHLVGDGVVLDMPRKELEKITASDLEGAKPKILKDDIVFIYTGWGKFFSFTPPEWEPGVYMQKRRPGLTKDAAEFLGKKKIKVLGIDTVAPQRGMEAGPVVNEVDPKYSIHLTLFKSDILIVECLTNLDQIAGKRVRIFILPLNLRDVEASPVRAIALIE